MPEWDLSGSVSARCFRQRPLTSPVTGGGYYISTTSAAYASVNRVRIGSDNGLSPIRHQAIIQTKAGLLLIGPLGTNVNGILIKIQNFLFTKMHLKISSVKWRPFFPGGDELRHRSLISPSYTRGYIRILTHTRPRDMARSRPPFWIFSFAAWKWVNMDGNWRNFDGNISSYV